MTVRAVCTSLEGPPCQRLVDLQAGHAPSASAPVTVEWVSETALTARPALGGAPDPNDVPGPNGTSPTTDDPVSAEPEN
jgi:hypothetical protein